MKDKVELVSFVVLLGGSMLLGLLGKPAEMAVAVVAGAFGLCFTNLDKIKEFKGAGFEAKMRDQLETIIEKETEPEITEDSGALNAEGYGLVGEDAPRVIIALLNPKYTWRYVSGLSKESGVSKNVVKETLDWLVENRLAKQLKNEQGHYWALTSKGREVFAEYANDDDV